MLSLLFGSRDPLDGFILAVFWIICIYFGLVLHEIAHGLVAKWNGDYTAKNCGRLSLNPVKHFDLIGFLMILLVGFGYAKPVPVNPYNFKKYRKGLFTVAIAGICTNLILAFFASLFVVLFSFLMTVSTVEGLMWVCYYIGRFFSLFMSINLSLAFFNLLPIFPLDGFRMVEVFTHQGNKFCSFMRTNGQYLLWGLVGLGYVISLAFDYAPGLPIWFSYFDVLGTYIGTCSSGVSWLFTSFWRLFFP